MTLNPRDTLDLLERYGLAPQRAFGQNFVVDPNTVRKIARLARVGPGDHVVEIGPGLGALTRALIETGAHVSGIEVDRGLAAYLRDEVVPLGATIIEADALTIDWSSTLSRSEHWVLVANLPYNIATPLIADILDGVPSIERMLLMVQKEAAQRLCAVPGSKIYGGVSVKVASWATAKIVGAVPPTVFIPRPKVDSALVEITRIVPPPLPSGPERDLVFQLVTAGFGQRRKMLRRSLVGVMTADAIERSGVRPDARAEELDLAAWVRMAQNVTS